jgi:tRNA A37 threonylcarbamoyladenosine biosynthesis protein TsaE
MKKYRIESNDEQKFTNLRKNVKRHGVSVVLCSEENEGEFLKRQIQIGEQPIKKKRQA